MTAEGVTANRPEADARDVWRRIRAIIGSSSGNLVEWFDFYTYSFTSLYFAPEFFPDQDQTTQLLKTAGIFAVGFVVRPIGSWLFGRIADQRGRRTSMLISVLMMCGGCLLMAALPTYAVIGRAAPVLLTVARLIQGLSVGGEYGTSATYMSEVALHRHRGFLGSFQYFTLIGGQLLALLVVVVLEQSLTKSELRSWGWRIPFLVGASAAVVAFYLRRSLAETTSTTVRRAARAGTLRGVFEHPRAFFTVLGFTAGGSLYFYTFTTYMQKYLVNTAHMEVRTTSAVMTAVLLCYMLLQPPFGALSDRIGRRNSIICFGVLGLFTTVPVLSALARVSDPYLAFALVMVSLTGLSFYTSISGLVKAELFPMHVRALGVGLSYAIANAAFGGTAEFVGLKLKEAGYENLFPWYATLMCAITLATALVMQDTRKTALLDADEHALADT